MGRPKGSKNILRTTTLLREGKPWVSLCPGHVSAFVFSKAFAEENWRKTHFTANQLVFEKWIPGAKSGVWKKVLEGVPYGRRFTVKYW